MLVKKWLSITSDGDPRLTSRFWLEIVRAYSEEHRAYHTINHIKNMVVSVAAYEVPRSFEFAIFYHDFVYDTKSLNNEENSTEIARMKAKSLGYSDDEQDLIEELIMSTKHHMPIGRSKYTSLFLDADLSKLGSEPEEYNIYKDQIRSEYNQFSDEEYGTGRAKFLNKMLKKENIFNTATFRAQLQHKAVTNMLRELHSLGIKQIV